MADGRAKRRSPSRRRIIKRPRITRLLDQTTSRTIMLVAPAGYGKTTLARQWLEERPHGWYAATQASSDVAALAAGLAAAAADFVEGAGSRMIERLRAAGAPPPSAEALAGLLAEDLASWPDDVWLAIDDYHLAMESEDSEEFVEELLVQSPVRLLLTSRVRPAWATARRLLYGDILEVGRSTLALTHDEAGEVLADRSAREVAGLMAVADGWPAVIGLAALSQDPLLSEAQLPDTLYEYCAEELFRTLQGDVQSALCQLSVVPGAISERLLRSLFGRAWADIARRGERAGFLSRAPGRALELHPLLKTFLEAKRSELGSDAIAYAVEKTVEAYRTEGRWDEAFQVVEHFGDAALFQSLLDSALDDLLSRGRVGTLERWLTFARAFSDSALLDLAEAEVAFRSAEYSRVEALAEAAVSRLKPSAGRHSHALRLAGYGAYFASDLEPAQTRLQLAAQTARTRRDAREAIWGLLGVSQELEERDKAHAYLTELAALDDLDPDEEIRLTQARLVFAYRFGEPIEVLRIAQLAPSLLSRVRSPLVRTGFLNSLAYALVIEGCYAEAETWANALIEEAESHRLPFANPHGYATRARAECGLRRFSQALRTLALIDDLGLAERNVHIEVNAATVRARVELGRSRPDAAHEAVRREFPVLPDRSSWGEYLGLRGLSLLALGQHEAALKEVVAASEVSSAPEPRALRLAADAITGLEKGAAAADTAVETFVRATSLSGCTDVLVTAYRTHPPLLRTAVQCAPDLRSYFTEAVTRACDWRLGRSAGLDVSPPDRQARQLTKRELEVYELLLRGLSNRDIAKKLFISEVTVKVHVRHIFAKLEVRSRTEAIRNAVGIEYD